MSSIRPAAVAGTFYPEDSAHLRTTVETLLLHAPRPAPDRAPPKALIVPHAGYRYSGPIAASAYACLAAARTVIRRVVLLGPVHRVPVRGLALPGVDALSTPLGVVQVDRDAVEALIDLPQVVTTAAAHAEEHSLEVHLPFLQTVLADFTIVPLAVGDTTPDSVAEVLDRLWGGPETLIVVSSDLSHYLPAASASREDRATAEAILALDPSIDHAHACGATPVNGLIVACRARGLYAELLDLRNSGDTAGDRSRVVGYASFAFWKRGADTVRDANRRRGQTLLEIARATVARQLGLDRTAREDASFLRDPGATFVTLHGVEGQLRGCIGSLEAHRSLLEDVKKNARSAAFLDPRFPPLSLREFDRVTMEVSELSRQVSIDFRDESDLIDQLRPGVDGLVLEADGRRATFLPQVWDGLPTPTEFLAHLRRKAGLPVDHPLSGARVARYTVTHWSEHP